MLGLIALGVIALLAAGYVLYGRFIARQYALDDARTTPAVEKQDGVEFVPARPFYLLGQHFSAIAAAGPIVGPISAALVFGWGPALLWIVLGVIFIGAVHDFSALVSSVRHGARSIAAVAREHLGKRAWLVLTLFIYIALLYIVTAFTDVTADTFKGLSEELAATKATFNKGGAVAAASTMYLLLALVMGLTQRYSKLPMLAQTLIFVPSTLGVVALGTRLDSLLNFDKSTWHVLILGYCLLASVAPLWLLQQPRGYLGGWVLYLACALGILGILFGGFEIRRDAFAPAADYGAFFAGGKDAPALTQLLFPFLFVTIACGACSGFHGLICGGTTSRQIAKESHCKPVAFGAMLLEGLVAVVALSTVMIVAKEKVAGRAPGVLYGDGLATFLTRFLDPAAVRSGDAASSKVFALAATFGAMAFSTFVFDTLDVSVRLGRYLLSELLGFSSKLAGLFASLVTCAVPFGLLALSKAHTPADGKPAYLMFWTLFGTSNQLLAALTLLGVTVWLRTSGKRCWYVVLPMCFVFAVTLSALALQVHTGVREVSGAKTFAFTPAVLNAIASCALLLLAGVFVAEAVRALRVPRGTAQPR
jgi:carbon starvation protein